MIKSTAWKNLIIFSVMAAYFYVFMEWLFIVTMPSYMSAMSVLSKIEIMFAAGGTLSLAMILPMMLIALIDIYLFKSSASNVVAYVALAVPSFVLSSLFLLLIDNFTYTIFKFGIVDTSGWWRGLYTIVFLVLFFYSFRWGGDFISRSTLKITHFDLSLVLVIGVIVVTGISAAGQFNPLVAGALASPVKLDKRPNVLIIGSDGVNANNMSLYGYSRDTTPNLRTIALSSLVAENAFTNSGASASSVTSILTGKLPTQTHVYGEGNILTGENAYQHLPGILNEQGYYTVQIGVPHYVDAYDLNFQGGFDLVNHRSDSAEHIFQLGTRFGFGSFSYLLQNTFERISSRLLHIFFVRKMENPYDIVMQLGNQIKLDDQEKVDQLLDLISNTREPLFVHVHLMGTHGSFFAPKNQLFSGDEKQNQEWMIDFYDDAIYDFDGYVKEVFDALSASGKLDNTIVVIYTDHNMLHETNQRIPLIIHFPNNEFAGVINNNVQNIDIAPTILDYLNIPKPKLMSGLSLLSGEPPTDRLVFSYSDNVLAATVVDCNHWYRFEQRGVWFTGEVHQHTAPCTQDNVSSLHDIPESILGYIQENNFVLNDAPESESTYLSFSGNPSLAQIAVILLKAKYGDTYSPPPASGIFADVPISDSDAGWIEQSYQDGIISSCTLSPLSYCPQSLVTRGQMAEYLLKAKDGQEYTPPPATGIFEDVPKTSPFAPWIEELYRRKITGGCSTAPLQYCPDSYLTGGQFTTFLNRVFVQP